MKLNLMQMTVGTHSIFDLARGDRAINPTNKYADRGPANPLMRIIVLPTILGLSLLGISSCTSINSQVASQADVQTQSTLKVAGSSSTTTLFKILADAYQNQNPKIKIEFVSNSQSEGAIGALKNNIVDIAASSHKLKPEEDNGKIQYREVARDALIVATHNSVQGVTELSTEQLKAIYRGEIINWKELGGPDAAIVVLDRPEDESAKKLLRQYYLDQDKTTEKAIVLNKEGELIDTLQSTPYSIGAFSLAYSVIHQLPINRLHLNGVIPDRENSLQGKYPMVRHLGMVWQKTPTPTTQEFVNFVFSPIGAKILKDNGFIPAN